MLATQITKNKWALQRKKDIVGYIILDSDGQYRTKLNGKAINSNNINLLLNRAEQVFKDFL